MERTTCAACGGTELMTFLDLGKTPLANSYPDTVSEEEIWYPLGLCRCNNCHLVQNIEIVPDELIYGDHYGFYSGGSAAQRAYQNDLAEKVLLRYYRQQASWFTVEIGCNDGTLLEHFTAIKYRCLGVDPSHPAQAGIDRGLPIIKEPFTSALARKIRFDHGPAGLIVANNVLAHISDLSDVLTGIWELLADNGVAVIEMQYLPDMLAGNMIGQVYHEHRYYYSLSSFARVAELHQLYVVDAELIEFQGGAIRIVLSNDPNRRPTPRTDVIFRAERWLQDPAPFLGVQGRVERLRDHLLDLIGTEIREGRVIMGYAAAAKATTILNYCGINRKTVPFVFDATPYKQGRMIPGVKIPIIDPARFDTHGLVDEYDRLLLATNYLPHLLRTEPEFLQRGGRWIVVEPLPMII